MQSYFFSMVETKKHKFSCKKASAILSRTVRIQEDQFKLNSKLVLTNYLPMKECCKHRLYLETGHYLSLGRGGGFVGFCLCHEKIYLITP